MRPGEESMRTLKLVGACLLGAVVVAGCGSSAEGSSRSEYIAMADKICAKQNRIIQRRIAPEVKGATGLPMPIGSAQAVRKVLIPGLTEEIRGLRGLASPPEDSKFIEEFLSAMRLMVGRAVRSPPYVAKAPRPFLRTELMGEQYGFKVCGYV